MISTILRKMLATAAAVGFSAVTGSAEVIDTSDTVTRSDDITGGLTKQGIGTVRLTGERQTITGDFTTKAGVSKVEGALSVSGWVGVESAGKVQISGSLACGQGAGGLWMNQGAQVAVSGSFTDNNILAVKGGVFRQESGTVTVGGSQPFGLGGYDNYESTVAYIGTYELNGGTLNVTPDFHIGRYSPGNFLQSGGTVNVVGVPSIGRYATGVGVAKHTGGVFNQTTSYRGYIVGEEGAGELVVDGDALVNVTGAWGVALGANAANASGTLKLYGGTLAAQFVQGGSGTSRVILNGGTLKALKDTDAFIAASVGACEMGQAGVTIDTDGHNVANAQPIVGTMSSDAKLTHRWSFNGSWEDSVGGSTAVGDGAGVSFNADSTACVLQGGNYGTGAVNLGTGLLPTGNKGFTLEFWMTEDVLQNWSRAFSVGPNANNCIWLAWNNSGVIQNGSFAVVASATSSLWLPSTLGGFGPLGTEYHVAVVAEPKENGTYQFSLYKQNAVTGETIASAVADAPADWTPTLLSEAPFWLGRSLSAGDKDASATYNEVRIWDAPLTEADLSCNARLGPDQRMDGVFVKKGAGELALSGANTFTTPVRVEGGTLALPSGATMSAPVTIAAGGVLSVTGESVPVAVAIEVSATEKSSGCLLMTDSPLDLSSLSVTIANVSDLNPRYSYVIARSLAGFVGTLDATGLPDDWQYIVRGNEVKLFIPRGAAIILR